jgi:hypothetical protein
MMDRGNSSKTRRMSSQANIHLWNSIVGCRIVERFLVILGVAIACVGCGSSGSVPAPSVSSISVQCVPNTIYTTGNSNCTATISPGNASQSVTWSTTSGSLSSLTANPTVFSQGFAGTASISATATQNSLRSSPATVNVTVQPVVTGVLLTCSPTSILATGASTCVSYVSGQGSYNSSVTWSISPSSGGSISSTGVFTPSGPGTVIITATSVLDSVVSNGVTVTVSLPPSITGVSPTCTPSAILTTQTSTCTAVVSGQGHYNPAVTWSVPVGTNGTITPTGGVFSPTGAGTATIVATSVQDSTKSGSTHVVASVPPSIVSVTVTCPTSIVPAATATCTATVQGQGNFDPTVIWSTNIGTISSGGVFSPSGVERATITATSVEDTTKSGSGYVISDIQLVPGTIYWGADGLINQGNAYYSISVSQQVQDLQGVFGKTPNTIFYRAWELTSSSTKSIVPSIAQVQSMGVIPLVGVASYPGFGDPCVGITPGWSLFANDQQPEQQAYNWAYCNAVNVSKDAPTNFYWYVGNEWPDQWPPAGTSTPLAYLPQDCQNSDNGGTSPSTWATNYPCYKLFRGVLAGTIAGLQDTYSYIKVIPGFNGDDAQAGLAAALALDLSNPLNNLSGRALSWNATSVHWGSDIASDQMSGNYAHEGPPDNFIYPGLASNNEYSIDSLANVGLPTRPTFFTEISSSDGQNPTANTATVNSELAAQNDPLAGQEICAIMNNMQAHALSSATEGGVVGGNMYQLYQMPGTEIDRYLYYYQAGALQSGGMSPQGTAVHNCLVALASPSGSINPTVSVPVSVAFAVPIPSATSVNIGGTVNANVTLLPTTYSGTVTLKAKVWGQSYTNLSPISVNPLPTCQFSLATLTGNQKSVLTCTVPANTPQGTYVVSVNGTAPVSGGMASIGTSFSFTVP